MTTRSTAPTPAPPSPIRDDIRSLWMLDDRVDFLNHGSFGARLRSVHDAQIRWREQMEARPVEFLDRSGPELLAEAKAAVGRFLGMQADHFGFTTNATDGVNAVLRSLRFQPGDELITTNHVYEAVRRAMRHLAKRAGATVIEVDVPLPIHGPEAIVAAIDGAISDRTRLVVVDHITSPTAVVFPIAAIIERCAARGVDVLVDGAHAPGMLELDVEELGAAYYAGNLHKWVGAPPGAGFLWVREDRQAGIHPTVLSLRLGDGFANEFSWQGTRDVSSWLTAPDAIEAMDNLNGPGSWPRVMRHNHELAVWVQQMLSDAWDVTPNTPRDGSMLGSMASLPLPAELEQRFETRDALQAKLYADHRIEVFVLAWGGRRLVRPCCQVYNTAEQYRRLAAAVCELVH
ncbi:MAG: aminotransferase class V-fold PLP-dependent enzyme [Planctomycetota bacterium]|nr:aminotransferase class V-fold PLP-dependent enzyme [Planctomycetota bacterium]